jgi:hypothetical protein
MVLILAATALLGSTGKLAAALLCAMLGVVVYSPTAQEWAFLCRRIAPLFLLLLIGFLYSYQNDNYEVVKDILYLLKIPFFAVIGLMIGRGLSLQRLSSVYIMCSVIFAAVFILRFAAGSGGEANEFARTSEAGGAPLFTCFALAIAMRAALDGRELRLPIPTYVAVSVLLLTAALSMSRSYLVCTGICLFVLSNTMHRLIVIAVGSVGILALVSWVSVNPEESYFVFKILNSLTEISFVSSFDLQDILTNWRGFEAAMAWDQFQHAPLGEQLFGQGLGTTVALQGVYYLDGVTPFSDIPTLHNGYMYILTKFGIVGILIYLLSIYVLFSPAIESRDPSHSFQRQIAISFVLIALFTTGIITGLFNKTVVDPVFMCAFAFMTASVPAQAEGRSSRGRRPPAAPRWPALGASGGRMARAKLMHRIEQ